MDDNHRCGELFQAICPVLVEYLKPKKQDTEDTKESKYDLRKNLRRVNKALRCLVDCTIERVEVSKDDQALPLSQSWRRWPNLKRLEVSFAPMTDIIPSLYHEGGSWGGLTALEVNVSSMNIQEAFVFAKLAALHPQLRYLSFWLCRFEEDCMLQIARASWPALEQLNLCFSGHPSKSISLAKAMGELSLSCPSLRKLDLIDVDVSSCEVMEGLVSTCFPVLEELNLDSNELRDYHGELFGTKGPVAFPSLRVLCLPHCALDDKFVKSFALSTWPVLEKLDLGGNSWTLRGGIALANASSRWPSLRSVDIERCHITNEILQAILQGSWLSLEYLNLFGNPLSKEGYMALAAAAPRLPELQKLCIGDADDYTSEGDIEEDDLVDKIENEFEWLLELLAAPWPSLNQVAFSMFPPDVLDNLGLSREYPRNLALPNGWRWHDDDNLLIRRGR